ncbi:MAG: hypothetical protein RIQ81_997 [Pseudomonadota bacterium]
MIIVFGDTYRHRDAIKALGGRYDGVFKNWQIPFSDDTLTMVQKMAGQRPSIAAPDAGIATPDGKDPTSKGQDERGIAIRDLVNAVHRTITTGFPAPVWVIGEIENLAVRPQGIFLNLAEPKSTGSLSVKATIWPTALEFMARIHGEDTVRQILQDGIQVRCLCRVGFYKDRAQLSLTIENVDPVFTQGALALAREKLLKELRAKGLDRKNKMLAVPAFPLKVGLVSADGSRAESDFLHQLESGGFPGSVLFAAAATQGEEVKTAVPRALTALAEAGCDVVVITRGGGSAADLRWFDTPEVAYAIADCPVPVIAAIGHHDDTCVAEEICHSREKTPTAAAQHILNLFLAARQRIELAGISLQNVMERLSKQQLQLFAMLEGRLHASAARALAAIAANLANIEARLAGLDPSPWLEKGWTRLAANGKTIDSIRSLTPGMVVTARLKDGHATLQVAGTTGAEASKTKK